MPFQIVRNDITKMNVDAIVNAAKPSLLGGGGVDGAIHAAAGPGLLEECRTLGGCETGQAKITGGYDLPSRYVIHTVGPVWQGGQNGEREKLTACYRNSLELAKEHGCETVAFPLISAGIYGYPKDRAMKVAVDAIAEFLMENDMTVYLVIYGRGSLDMGHRLFPDIQEYIDDHYVEERAPMFSRRGSRESNRPMESAAEYEAAIQAPRPSADQAPKARRKISIPFPKPRPKPRTEEDMPAAPPLPKEPEPDADVTVTEIPIGAPAVHDGFDREEETTRDLDLMFEELDESFQQMLLRKIDERGMTDAQCYHKANVDRKLFSKIRKDTYYRPSKPTAIAFAIALELNRRETDELLKKAGYALSRSNKFDVIIQYYIDRKIYNIFEINETLFFYDQCLLGA